MNEQVAYAGFWIRFCAYVLDVFIATFVIAIPYTVLSIIVNVGISALSLDANTAYVIYLFMYCIYLAACIGYFVVLPSTKWQATPGKKLLGLQIVNAQGKRISFLRALVRFVSMFFSSLLLMFGYVMAGIHPKKRSLHDILGNTYVIYKPDSTHTESVQKESVTVEEMPMT